MDNAGAVTFCSGQQDIQGGRATNQRQAIQMDKWYLDNTGAVAAHSRQQDIQGGRATNQRQAVALICPSLICRLSAIGEMYDLQPCSDTGALLKLRSFCQRLNFLGTVLTTKASNHLQEASEHFDQESPQC